MDHHLEIESSDVVRLILQFLRENKLHNTMQTLEQETSIHLNAVESVESLVEAIVQGKWHSVVQQTSHLACSPKLMMALYEQMLLEMMEQEEYDVARELLRCAEPFAHMKQTQPERFLQLHRLVQHKQPLEPQKVYQPLTKQAKRTQLAQEIKAEVQAVAPSRLLHLLGQALKWQRSQGLVAPGSDHNLFLNAPREVLRDASDEIIQKNAGKIKFSVNSCVQCARFSRDGQMLVTGTKDGFIEVWDPDKRSLRKDLEYQNKEEFMMQESSVLCQAMSCDGELLATASDQGHIKVWKLSSGLCLRRFELAHAQSIQSICFSRDGSQLLTGSFDQVVRIHGLKSGQTLKEFRGHEGYVNDAIFTSDSSRIISCSCDGTVKLWDSKSAECLSTWRPPNAQEGVEVEVVQLALVSEQTGAAHEEETVIVCTRAQEMYRFSLGGQLLETFSIEQTQSTSAHALGVFVACVLSPRNKWLYGVTDKGFLACFAIKPHSQLTESSLSSSSSSSVLVEFTTQICTKEAFGIIHHPFRNLIATYGADGYVRLWKA